MLINTHIVLRITPRPQIHTPLFDHKREAKDRPRAALLQLSIFLKRLLHCSSHHNLKSGQGSRSHLKFFNTANQMLGSLRVVLLFSDGRWCCWSPADQGPSCSTFWRSQPSPTTGLETFLKWTHFMLFWRVTQFFSAMNMASNEPYATKPRWL